MKQRRSKVNKKPAVIPDEKEVDLIDRGDSINEEPIVDSTPKKKDDTRPVPVVGKRHLQNIYGTRVIVEASRTPSGKRYEFLPGQTLPVESQDYHYLLSLNKNPGPGCCGGTPAEQAQRHYFGTP